MGPNTSGVNGFALKKSETQVLKHGDRLEILLGQYIHRVEFQSPPSMEIKTEGDGKKRKLDEISLVGKKVCCESLKRDSVMDITEPSSDSKWESIDNGKLLIYTAKNVVAQSKVKRNTFNCMNMKCRENLRIGIIFPFFCTIFLLPQASFFPSHFDVTFLLRRPKNRIFKIVK